MTSEGLGEMFEGDSADTGAGKFTLVSMGGRAEGLACADPGARTPIGASRNFVFLIKVTQSAKQILFYWIQDFHIIRIRMDLARICRRVI